MIWLTLFTALALLPQAQAANEPAKPDASAAKTESTPSHVKPINAETNASALNAKLLTITRIYIDDFGTDPTAKQIQAMVVNSISESKRFIVTENKEKADAVLKGTALEKTSQEFHALNDKAAAASSHGSHTGSVSGTFNNGNGSIYGSSSGYHAGSAVAADDSTASTETINDARVAVRLVAADGDVIWSTTQESRGAKYKGASADVADKVVKRLMLDLDKLQAANKPK